MVASEATPWAKTGGLADVAGALPESLESLGHDITLVMPRYRGVDTSGAAVSFHPVRQGTTVHTIARHVLEISPRRRVVFIDVPGLFDREDLYGTGGVDFADNAVRFDLLAVAALDLGQESAEARPVDVIHGHDWQAGTVAARVRTEPGRWPALATAGIVLTVHNLAYQGAFEREVVPRLGLSWDVFRMERGEFYGRFSFLKAGLSYADMVTTVSPQYAAETLTAEFGCGFEGLLASLRDRYLGILNGIDAQTWNPATDAYLAANYDADDLAGKAVCKRALLAEFGLPQGDDAVARPLVGLVSRLVEQKGFDLIEAASDELTALDAAWVFVGSGEVRYERFLRDLAARHPSRVGVHIGFNERLAHMVEAGADLFLMPSRFEPCGLNQMYSLRYGTVPIVRAVGGLDDTIQPYTARALHANGFKFKADEPAALARTVRQALRLYQNPPVWRRLIRQGMAANHSWLTSAREYVKVYRRARAAGAARGGLDGHSHAKG